MAEFKYITKLNQHPQGKQRVYFTCHPYDFKPTFEEIKKDILDRQDVAIFYLEPDTRPDDVNDYELQLGEMQLFVVPVTTKLLTTPNRAIDVEVPFAQEHHIPILPLMYESGLDELFNRKFGDLQYLDKFNTDPTAISFDDKLTRYLDSIIVDDKISEKVRAAFDAYVFLSYRKKDRQYAQKLMKLIHNNPNCRDIAIWYDEFLTPGENFNNAIESAMRKSDIFALTVTPNLVNEDNYVRSIEYPKALEFKKNILPVEMIPTNKHKLKKQYKNIPTVISGKKQKTLDSQVIDYLKDIALIEGAGDPQHDYFIALAYLSGIDVEVDYERAVALMTESAKAGCSEAVENLVDIYNQGKGVKRDYKHAAMWHEKFVEICSRKYEQNKNEENAELYIKAQCKQCDMYFGTAQYEKASRACELLTTIGKETAQKYQHNSTFPKALTKSLDILSDIAYLRYERNNVLELSLKSLAVLKNATEIIDSESLERHLALAYTKAAQAALNIGKVADAEDYIFKAVFIAENMFSADNMLKSGRSLSDIYHTYNKVLCQKGDFDTALKYSKKALEINENLAVETESSEDRRNLGMSYEAIGDIFRLKKDYEESNRFYDIAQRLYIEIFRENESLSARRNNSSILLKISKNYRSMYDDDNFMRYILSGVRQKELIAEETDTIEDRQSLIDTYLLFADQDFEEYKFGDHFEEFETDYLNHAVSFYQKAETIAEKLLLECDNVRVRVSLHRCWLNLTDIYQRKHDDDLWKYYAVKAYSIIHKSAECGTVNRELKDYGWICMCCSNVAKSKGDYKTAEECLLSLLTYLDNCARETDSKEDYVKVSKCYIVIADYYESIGDKANEEMFRGMYRNNNEENDDDGEKTENSFDKSDYYLNLGIQYADKNEISKAEDFFDKSVELAKQIAQDDPTPGNYAFLENRLFKYGCACHRIDVLNEGAAVIEYMKENWNFFSESGYDKVKERYRKAFNNIIK